MKKFTIISIIVCLVFSVSASAQGVWTRKADYTGAARFDFTGYGLNNKGYIGAGRHSLFNSYMGDWMEFDPILNTWIQKAALPMPISAGTAFVAGNKGFVACGANDRTYIYDTYVFDPLANSWTAKTVFNQPRQRATGVGNGDMGYIIGGYDVMGLAMNECWEYNQLMDTWSQKASLPISASRYDATGFALNGKVYVFGGSAGINMLNDLWEFDIASNLWTQKASLPGIGRKQAMSYVINNVAYVIGGNNYMGYLNECWKYDATLDQWIRLPDFPGTRGPSGGVGFEINGLGYIVNGNGTNECWEFNPLLVKNGSLITYSAFPDQMMAPALKVFPNPATSKVYVNIPGGITVKSINIYNVSGEIIRQDIQMLNATDPIDISNIEPGVYFVTVITNDGTLVNGKFIKTN
jgi:N-acetylneuraminic acid mutarotase